MRVVVLMSTYQGERYVGDQLASVLEQLPPEGRIVIRDDGSTDGTVDRILTVADKRVSLVRGPNIGFVRSFFWLMESAPPEAEMIMLCDQDDVWLPGKIERAWQALKDSDGEPTLYCSRLRLVDPRLGNLGLSPRWPRPPSFANALAENIVTGCTAALNPAALRIACRHGDLSRIHFHDWWLYLVITAFGHVIYDPEPTVLYRQHEGNVIGMGSGLARYRAILRFLRRTNWVHVMFNQIENFRAVHGPQLIEQRRQLLDRFFNPRDAMATARLVVTSRRFQQSLLGEAFFRLMLVACIASGRGLLPENARAAARA
jgi:glycosyltransferase involved in cell wall biosynthesis